MEVVLVWPIVKLMIISKDFYSHDKCLHVHANTQTHTHNVCGLIHRYYDLGMHIRSPLLMYMYCVAGVSMVIQL